MHKFFAYVLQDWAANDDANAKSRFVVVSFRLAQALSKLPGPFSLIFKIYRILYQLIVEWIMGIDLPWDTQVGPKLKLLHAQALVVNHYVVIGSHCILRHSVTIGNKKLGGGYPKIGNHVEIGASTVILGEITIGDHVTIGAGSIVVKDVPAGATVAGNPAKIIRMRKPEDVVHSEEAYGPK
jgi:putative colanic acid biosynthesis acetyltransferase WcaB